jgi:hypothetical protein
VIANSTLVRFARFPSADYLLLISSRRLPRTDP